MTGIQVAKGVSTCRHQFVEDTAMKKLIIMATIRIIMSIGNSSDDFLFSHAVLQAEPTTHSVQQGECLSEIAQRYYGHSDYWRELALVNRAPNPNSVLPGDELFIPGMAAMMNIRAARTISDINLIVQDEEDVLIGLDWIDTDDLPVAEQLSNPDAIPALPKNTNAKNQVVVNAAQNNPIHPLQSSSLNLIFGIIASSLIGGIISLWVYHRKQQAQFEEQFALLENINLDDAPDEPIYVDDEQFSYHRLGNHISPYKKENMNKEKLTEHEYSKFFFVHISPYKKENMNKEKLTVLML
jgi:hypothetical protein